MVPIEITREWSVGVCQREGSAGGLREDSRESCQGGSVGFDSWNTTGTGSSHRKLHPTNRHHYTKRGTPGGGIRWRTEFQKDRGHGTAVRGEYRDPGHSG